MAKLRNINTGVVISFDDALVDNFSRAEWEPIGTRSTTAPGKSAVKKAAPAKKAAAKKTAAKKPASVAATQAVVDEATTGS